MAAIVHKSVLEVHVCSPSIAQAMHLAAAMKVRGNLRASKCQLQLLKMRPEGEELEERMAQRNLHICTRHKHMQSAV